MLLFCNFFLFSSFCWQIFNMPTFLCWYTFIKRWLTVNQVQSIFSFIVFVSILLEIRLILHHLCWRSEVDGEQRSLPNFTSFTMALSKIRCYPTTLDLSFHEVQASLQNNWSILTCLKIKQNLWRKSHHFSFKTVHSELLTPQYGSTNSILMLFWLKSPKNNNQYLLELKSLGNIPVVCRTQNGLIKSKGVAIYSRACLDYIPEMEIQYHIRDLLFRK